LQDLIGEINDLKDWQYKINDDLNALNRQNENLKHLLEQFDDLKKILVFFFIFFKEYFINLFLF
jgi:hypothetical protein